MSENSFKLDERLDILSERVAGVEAAIDASSKKTKIEIFSASAGFLALAISIFTGSFTLYDRFMQEQQRDVVAFAQAMDDFSEMKLKLENSYSVSREYGESTERALSLRLKSTIDKINDLYLGGSGVLTYAQVFALSQENFRLGNHEMAFQYAEAAIAKAEGEQEIEDARANKALLLVAPSPRQDIEGARVELEGIVSPNGKPRANRLGVLYEWFNVEISQRNCVESQRILDMIYEIYKLGIYSKVQIDRDIARMKEVELLSETGCALEHREFN